MKKNTIVWLLALCSVCDAWSQSNTEGKIIFEHKVNMHRQITDEAMKAMVPEYRTTQMQLNYRAGESLYMAVPKEEDDSEINSTDNNGNQMRMVVRMPQNEVYRNYDTQEKIELRELAGQKFLVSDTLKRANWKITGETKKILGYDCMQATMTNPVTKQVTVAWFTEAIPVPHGPMIFGGLPGMILEVNINDGQMLHVAQKIDFKALSKDEFRKPSGGKKVTEAQFTKERDAWMKEMGIQPGSSGSTFKVIRN